MLTFTILLALAGFSGATVVSTVATSKTSSTTTHVGSTTSISSVNSSSTTSTTSSTSSTTSSAESCAYEITKTINFDSIPTGSGVPAGRGFANWNGFTVTSPDSPGFYDPIPINPKSGSNFAQIPWPLGAHIDFAGSEVSGTGYGNSISQVSLKSFYFACAGQFPGGVFPVNCDIEILGNSYEGGVETYGPFTYSSGSQMAKADLSTPGYGVGYATADQYFFVMTAGGVSHSLDAYVFIDSVVLIGYNETCVDCYVGGNWYC